MELQSFSIPRFFLALSIINFLKYFANSEKHAIFAKETKNNPWAYGKICRIHNAN